MSKPDLGRIIAQTMAKPVEGRTIETITDEILDAKRTGGEAILTIGRCLIEAKDMLPHGEWLPWLNERVEFSERTARNFMRLAREWTNRQTLADLGASKALTLLALPAEEREQFMSETHQVDGQEKNVIDMPSWESTRWSSPNSATAVSGSTRRRGQTPCGSWLCAPPIQDRWKC